MSTTIAFDPAAQLSMQTRAPKVALIGIPDDSRPGFAESLSKWCEARFIDGPDQLNPSQWTDAIVLLGGDEALIQKVRSVHGSVCIIHLGPTFPEHLVEAVGKGHPVFHVDRLE